MQIESSRGEIIYPQRKRAVSTPDEDGAFTGRPMNDVERTAIEEARRNFDPVEFERWFKEQQQWIPFEQVLAELEEFLRREGPSAD